MAGLGRRLRAQARRPALRLRPEGLSALRALFAAYLLFIAIGLALAIAIGLLQL